MPRHFPHRCQHAGVADITRGNLPLDHRLPLRCQIPGTQRHHRLARPKAEQDDQQPLADHG